MRKAELSIHMDQALTFILIAVAIFLLIMLVIGIRGNIESLGNTFKSVLEAIF